MPLPEDIRKAYHALPPQEQAKVRQLAWQRYQQLTIPTPITSGIAQANREIRRDG